MQSLLSHGAAAVAVADAGLTALLEAVACTPVEPAVAWLVAVARTYPVAAGTLAAIAAYYLLAGLGRKKSRRGFGSGENTLWNRRIRTERPVHAQKHYQLEKTWIYTGAGTTADLDAVAAGVGAGKTSAVDPGTKAPLTGHLIGRQTWQALPASHWMKGVQDSLSYDPSANINAGDKLLRAQMLAAHSRDPSLANPPPPRGAPSVTPQAALEAGWDFFASIQTNDGHWAGDYGGPLFLMPGLVITAHVAGVPLGDRASAMLTYLMNHQQADGGWGLHIEGPSTVFGTAMNYVACRLLGLPADHQVCALARAFIHEHGGATGVPHWGKFWLSVLGVYEWEGCNPVPPELWLLPNWFPFHPGKMWCHCRMVYLPMSYVYGIRGTAPPSPIVAELRKELYTQPYESINWDAQRNNCASIDLYAPHTFIMEAAFWVFRAYENWCPRYLFNPVRAAGVKFALEYVHAEDLQTNYVDIGPVNKVINMLSVFFACGPQSEQFRKHVGRMDDYLWVAEDGMKMQGYNGSQLWDTAFAMQAFAESKLLETLPAAAGSGSGAGASRKLAERLEEMAARAFSYFDASQIKEDVPLRERFYRTVSKGGWPFSTNDHGWPIADCTSEGVKASLALMELASLGALDLGAGSRRGGKGPRESPGWGRMRDGVISKERFCDAVDVILAFHNPHRDGGWATYEETRGGPWYEFLNPAEVFGDIMIDYTYTELTSSCVTALAAFRRHFPDYRPGEVDAALGAGLQYVRDQQREDGSWYGSWAVCFTYGAWFGVEALVAAGDPSGRDRAALAKACSFLLSKQRPDGGWGESYLSCLTKVYSQGTSSVVQTAWALLALTHAQCADAIAVRRGIDFLLSRQTAEGDWAQESVSGIFNRTCSITYTAYRNVFPLWALAAYVHGYAHRMDRPVASALAASAGSGSSDGATSGAAAAAASFSPVVSMSARGRSSSKTPAAAVVASGGGGGSARKRASSAARTGSSSSGSGTPASRR